MGIKYVVNATTHIFHNEIDYTYTLTSVPLQNKSMKMCNDSNILGINQNPKFSMFFFGLLVTHRQHAVQGNESGNSNDIFMNVSSYDNKHLFCHIKKLFQRTAG